MPINGPQALAVLGEDGKQIADQLVSRATAKGALSPQQAAAILQSLQCQLTAAMSPLRTARGGIVATELLEVSRGLTVVQTMVASGQYFITEAVLASLARPFGHRTENLLAATRRHGRQPS